jgi:2-enoate reductase
LLEANNKTEEVPCDSVILAVGYTSENSLYNELKYEFSDIHVIGDARKVSNIMYAIWDAFEVASKL